MRLEDVIQARPLERRTAGQEVVERAPQTVDVGADVGLAGIDALLRRDEVGRAEHLAFVCQRPVGRDLPAHLRQPEVKHLDHRPLSFTHISLLTEVLTVINLAAIFNNTMHLFELSNELNENTITV